MSNAATAPRLLGVTIVCLLLSACGGGGGGGGSPVPPSNPPGQNPPPTAPQLPDPATAPALKDEFSGLFRIGAAIEPEQLDIAADRALLLKHYSSLTAENAMKPDTIAPNDPLDPVDGGYRFDRAERIVQFAMDNSMEVHGHALLWHRTAPEWFFAGNPADPSYRATVQQRLVDYITAVVDHFEGRVVSWDVVNEVASDAAGEVYRTDSPWYEAFSAGGGDGREYIRIAFIAARAADSTAQLFINDYSTENPAKLAKVLEIIDYIEQTGEVMVDGVGHQFHLQRSAVASHMDNALFTVASENKLNRVSELDISIYADPGTCFSNPAIPPCEADFGADFSSIPQAVVSEQARLYRQLFTVFEGRDATLGTVTTWGISDAHTWLNTWPVDRTNRPLLFDRDGNPKLAFWAVVDPAFTIP